MNARVKYPTADFTLFGGRIVRGGTAQAGPLVHVQTKDHKGAPLPENKHHKWFAVAVPKAKCADVINGIYAHVQQSYAQVAGSGAVMQQIGMWLAAPAFAWKIDDGDTDARWSQRDGCAGCYVFQLSTNFEVTCFDNANRHLDPATFQLGDYVDVGIGVAINGEVGNTAGIFLNPRAVRLDRSCPPDQRISVGIDAASVFGAPTGSGYSRPLPQQQGPATSQTVTPPPAPAPAMPPQQPPGAEAVAAQYGVQHYPGHRYDPASNSYLPDQPPAPPTPPAAPGQAGPAPGYHAHGGPNPAAGMPGIAPQHAPAHPTASYAGNAHIPPAHAGGPVAPVGAPHYPAPSGDPGLPAGTAYPSSPPPGVNPHPGFVNGPR